jgi:CheY-like chemotaxis protein
MDRLPRVLILDSDPHTLITLQHALEQVEIDTTVTWDEAEACQLLETSHFDLILLGDHPPELNAAVILDDLSFRGTCPSVLDQVTRTLAPTQFKAKSTKAGLAEARSLRAAS